MFWGRDVVLIHLLHHSFFAQGNISKGKINLGWLETCHKMMGIDLIRLSVRDHIFSSLTASSLYALASRLRTSFCAHALHISTISLKKLTI